MNLGKGENQRRAESQVPGEESVSNGSNTLCQMLQTDHKSRVLRVVF